jgi:hypothetical protein
MDNMVTVVGSLTSPSDPYLYTDDGESRAVRRYQSPEAQRSGFVSVYSREQRPGGADHP